MAYAVTHHFPGGTQDQYEAVRAVVHPSHDSLPEGQSFHAAGAAPGGWTVFAVHDSQESWERFRDETLMPALEPGIDGGFETPPEETAYELHNLQP